MKLSARNKLKGKIVKIDEGVVTAKITIDIGNDNKITSTITMDAMKELNLKVGSDVYAVIKSSSVMVGIDE